MEKSLDWVGLKLLLLVVVMMMVLLMMMREQMMMVVMLQWHPVVAQPVLRGLRQGLKHPPLPLHELLDGWAVLRLVLLLVLLLLLLVSNGTLQQARNNISTVSNDYGVTSFGGHTSARVHCIIIDQRAGYRWASEFPCC